jgi:hypothetical protein
MSKKRPGPANPRPDDQAAWVPRPLGSKHRGTLSLVFDRPVRPDIPWRDIEALLVALGGEITQGRGSRVRVALGPLRAVFHEPHPERVTDKGAVESVRKFLENLGVRP